MTSNSRAKRLILQVLELEKFKRHRLHLKRQHLKSGTAYFDDALSDVERIKNWLDKKPVNLNLAVEESISPALSILQQAVMDAEKKIHEGVQDYREALPTRKENGRPPRLIPLVIALDAIVPKLPRIRRAEKIVHHLQQNVELLNSYGIKSPSVGTVDQLLRDAGSK